MGVYLEPVRRAEDGQKRSKLRADDVEELRAFVARAGLTGAPFLPNECVAALSYVELGPKQRRQALKAGAEALEWSAAHRRIAEQMVIGSRPKATKQGRFGVTRSISPERPTTSSAVIDLREAIDLRDDRVDDTGATRRTSGRQRRRVLRRAAI